MPYIMNDRPPPQPFLTDWFPPTIQPVRDGVYLVSQSRAWGTVRSDCWHAFRWDCKTRAWYAANSTGRHKMDLIGADRSNRSVFFWRGLAQEPQT